MARDSEPAPPRAPAASPAPEDPAGPGLDREYVVAYIPPNLPTRLVCWLAAAGPWGLWALVTAAEWESGEPDEGFLSPGRRSLFAPLAAPTEMLTIWVGGVLGFPVVLEPGTARYRAGRRLARPHEQPLFWVRRERYRRGQVRAIVQELGTAQVEPREQPGEAP